ncbi:unnamed protein product [Cuscuta epithymum]|uniref:FBD domain-containing protein n=1 Tax=Cuscuta epithymum TaxID=186058 RepID=A0AAV0FBH6_9ASTE|nr:unnamed protein product [Cuscuta epithymum]
MMGKTKLDKFPMEGGIDLVKLFPLMLKCLRLVKEVNLSCSRVPDMPSLERSIFETAPSLLHTMPFHLRRCVMLESDHEWSEEDGEDVNRLLFHLSRASASSVLVSNAA